MRGRHVYRETKTRDSSRGVEGRTGTQAPTDPYSGLGSMDNVIKVEIVGCDESHTRPPDRAGWADIATDKVAGNGDASQGGKAPSKVS